MRKGIRKGRRMRLMGLLAAFCVLLACGIGGGFAAKSYANSTSPHVGSEAADNADVAQTLDENVFPGEQFTLEFQPSINASKFGSTAASAMVFNGSYTIPRGISVAPFELNNPTSLQEVRRLIEEGEYSGDSSNPFLGGISSNGSLATSSPFTLEGYFMQACTQDKVLPQGIGSYSGKAVDSLLGSPSSMTPEECFASLQNNLIVNYSVGDSTYDIVRPAEMAEFLGKINIQLLPLSDIPNRVAVSNVSKIQISVSAIAMALYYALTGKQTEPVTGPLNVVLTGAPLENDLAYSSQGAVAEQDLDTTSIVQPTFAYPIAYKFQQYGSLTTSWESDLPSSAQILPSSDAGPLGLWFHLVNAKGEPVNVAKIGVSVSTFEQGSSDLRSAILMPSSSTTAATTSLSPYPYIYNYCYPDSGGCPTWQFSIDAMPHHPGYFGLSGLCAGTYTITILNASEGDPTFKVILKGYNQPEIFEAVNDLNIENSSTNTIGEPITSPNTQLLAGNGKVATDPQIYRTVGSENAVRYQLQSPIPDDCKSLKISISANSYGINASALQIAGLALSALQKNAGETILSTTSTGIALDFNQKALAYIWSKGHLPATRSSDNDTSTMGSTHILSVTIPVYLTSSFSNGKAMTYSLEDSSQHFRGNITPALMTNGTADGLPSASPSPTDSSSKTGLWFKLLSSAGKPITKAQFYVERYEEGAAGAMLMPVKTGENFSGWGWSGVDPYNKSSCNLLQNPSCLDSSIVQNNLITQDNSDGTYGVGGLGNGEYIVGVADASGSEGTVLTSFKVTLQGSKPEVISTDSDSTPEALADPYNAGTAGGYVMGNGGADMATGDYGNLLPSKDAVYILGSADINDGLISSQYPPTLAGAATSYVCPANRVSLPSECSEMEGKDYLTETVGQEFESDWVTFLPLPTGSAYEMQLNIPMNLNGVKLAHPTPDNISIAGTPLKDIPGVSEGEKEITYAAPENTPLPVIHIGTSGGSNIARSSLGKMEPARLSRKRRSANLLSEEQVDCYSITLTVSSYSYLDQHGINASDGALSSSLSRQVAVTFPTVLTSSFVNSQKSILGLEGISPSAVFYWPSYLYEGQMLIGENAAEVGESNIYTNGPANDSLPASLSMSSNSSETGLWFQSLWWGRGPSAYATGAKFTVSQTQGGKTVYLTPEEASGKFSGWSWKDSPYDFSEQNSDADFSFGGLADGTYTVTEVEPATGAQPSGFSFTGTLKYSSPESLKAVTNPLNLPSPSGGIVHSVPAGSASPSPLPLTGGNAILIFVASSILILVFGGVAAVVYRKRRNGGR